MAQLYIGLMSGTSVDSIDVALVDLQDQPRLLAHHDHPWPTALRQQILTLADSQQCSLDQVGMLDTAIGDTFAEAVLALLQQQQLQSTDIIAVGSHGQTVRHRPPGPAQTSPFSMQIGDANIIAERTGITTVSDFRRRDIAAGGQGAPLVPAFHQLLFAAEQTAAVLNIGGMANLTLLSKDPTRGFDTGPGNVLLDAWINKHQHKTFDDRGSWAQSGQIAPHLLQQLLDDPFFSLAPPKSTGREDFQLPWLEQKISALADRTPIASEDIQATLIALTCTSISQALERWSPAINNLWVCGGGAHNNFLMQQLQQHLQQLPKQKNCQLQSTTAMGIDPDWIEAMTFAWLAQQRLQQLPGNLAEVTGANGRRVLGAIYHGAP